MTKTHQVFLVKYKRIIIHIFWRNFFLTHTYICVIFFSWPSFGGIIQLNKCFYMCFNVDVITKIMCSMFLITWSQKTKKKSSYVTFIWIWIARFFLFKDLMLDSIFIYVEIWVRVIFILIYQWYILQLYVLWTLPYNIKKMFAFSNFRPRPIYHEVIMNVSWPYKNNKKKLVKLYFYVKNNFTSF